jgi:hypothetical protein
MCPVLPDISARAHEGVVHHGHGDVLAHDDSHRLTPLPVRAAKNSQTNTMVRPGVECCDVLA